jgi:hypothetical protein
MAAQRVTIALIMKFTAQVALNLALLPPVADRAPESPVICFMLVALNLVAIQAVLLGRPLRTFHHTFLAVGTVSSIALTVLSYAWTSPWKAVASVSAILMAWAVGLRAARRVRQRGGQSDSLVRIAPVFLQGMVIGFAFFALGATLNAWVVPEAPSPHTVRWYARIVGAITCPILGGLSVLIVCRTSQRGVDND